MSSDSDLRQLATEAGLSLAYQNRQGETVEASDEALRGILAAMGYDTKSPAQIASALAEAINRKRASQYATRSVEAGQACRIKVGSSQGKVTDWLLTLEDGSVHEGRSEIETAQDGDYLRLPPLPEGYHDLVLSGPDGNRKTTVLSAPQLSFMPNAFADQQRGFGFHAQVCGLKDTRNFGIGDLTDVGTLAEGAGQWGASFAGLSPLHALFTNDRHRVSPYTPSSRMFLDPLYIDPRNVPGFASSPIAQLLNQDEITNRIVALQSHPLLDYVEAWMLKREILDRLWQAFVQAEDDDFNNFRTQGGDALLRHATFESLSEMFARGSVLSQDAWPAEFRDPQSEAVSRFQDGRAPSIAFHIWLQWITSRQLAQAHERALTAGMPIGLCRDLAIGPSADGAEVWAYPEWYLSKLTIGEPPSGHAPQGQNLGVLPFDPHTLKMQGMAGFRALIRANMQHTGALRIGHASQVQRLFVIPAGASAENGAYLNFPQADLLAVLRIESKRASTLVIAGDCDAKPDEFSQTLAGMKILSHRHFSLEQDKKCESLLPGDDARQCLLSLPAYDFESPELSRPAAGADTPAQSDHRPQESLPSGYIPRLDTSIDRVDQDRLLAKSPAMLVGFELEPAGDANRANGPGSEHLSANWGYKMTTDVEQTLRPGGRVGTIASLMADEGRMAARPTPRMPVAAPRATYRLQFHKGFTFADAAEILPYLVDMGISHIYASPILQARPGSTHGYDIIDPRAINTEPGGAAAFSDFANAAKTHGLKILLDIVPNHMGVGGSGNRWWLSVLEWGENSNFAETFDIDWERLGADGKLVAPFLGEPYGTALEKGDLELKFDAAQGSFSVWHFEHQFPLCPLTYPDILDRAVAASSDDQGQAIAALLTVAEELRSLAHERILAPDAVAICEKLKRKIALLVRRPGVLDAVQQAISIMNGTPGVPESFNALHRLLDRQSYRLAFWRVASSDINYRRFFDIDSLAGVRIEEESVFQRVHELIFDMLRQGLIDGLRIDHIDGLADPKTYIQDLQRAVGPGLYIVAEKILGEGENLPDWPLAGTTGYDILNVIDGIFVDAAQERRFDTFYADFAGPARSYLDQLRAAKSQVLTNSFASELESLVSDMKQIANASRLTRDYSANAIRAALADLIIAFPVYRTYLEAGPVSAGDRTLLREVLAAAKRDTQLPDRTIHDFICSALLGTIPSGRPGTASAELVSRFRRRFQQLTGPVMAKSLEDTLFYRYVRFIALNEVGGEPNRFGIALTEFHSFNQKRALAWPHAMTATSTHDTKRGEDARARLLALSERPDLWAGMVQIWIDEAPDGPAPDRNDQYMLLQTIVGSWPIELLDSVNEPALASFHDRLLTYIPKAFRESKRHSKWVDPDEHYEAAAAKLVTELLDPNATFIQRMLPLVREIAYRGILISLVRTVLKCTLPGIPDFYQGTDLWDFSLVDPDNRRPVDYQARAFLATSRDPVEHLLATWRDGRVKQRLTQILTSDRAQHDVFYAQADYREVTVNGDPQQRVIAFLRSFQGEALLVLGLRLQGAGEVSSQPGHAGLQEATIETTLGSWRDIVTGRQIEIAGPVPVKPILGDLPFAVLRSVSPEIAEQTRPLQCPGAP